MVSDVNPHPYSEAAGGAAGALSIDTGAGADAARVGAKRATVRAAYFLCNVLPRLNAALLAYKRDVCPKRGVTSWNEEQSVRG